MSDVADLEETEVRTHVERFAAWVEQLPQEQLAKIAVAQRIDSSPETFSILTKGFWGSRPPKHRVGPCEDRRVSEPIDRDAAWLFLHLYAGSGEMRRERSSRHLRDALAQCAPWDRDEKTEFLEHVRRLGSSLCSVHEEMRWAIDLVHEHGLAFSWVDLLRDLAVWDVPSVRRTWTESCGR